MTRDDRAKARLGALVRQAQDRLVEIDAAMTRVGAGTYGVCQGCGATISDARLEARPLARACIACA